MGSHVVAVDEAEHVDAGCGVDADAGAAVDGLAAEDASGDVDHLEGSLTVVVDDEVAVAEEGEAVVVGVAGGEDDLEAVGVVRGEGVEAVGRVVEEVDVGTGHVVDEVQVVEADLLAGEAEGEAAVVLGLEADRHLAHGFAVHHSVVLTVDGDEDLGAVGVELELGQGAAFAEADGGAVDDLAVAAEVEGEHGALGGGGGGEGQGFTVFSGEDEEALHGFDLTGGFHEAGAFLVHDVEGTVDVGCHGEGVADEVPAGPVEVLTLGHGQDDIVVFVGDRRAGEGDVGAGVVGIEVAHAGLELVGFIIPEVDPFVILCLVEGEEVEVGGSQALHCIGADGSDRGGDEVVVVLLTDVGVDFDGVAIGDEVQEDGLVRIPPALEVVVSSDDGEGFTLEGDDALGVFDPVQVVEHLEGDFVAAGVVVDGVTVEDGVRVFVVGNILVVEEVLVSSAHVADERGDLEVKQSRVRLVDYLAVDHDGSDDTALEVVGAVVEFRPV